MSTLTNQNVSQIVASNYQTAKVFSRYGIDFCCKGGIPLSKACLDKDINITEIIEALEDAMRLTNADEPSHTDLVVLIEHIETVHHKYVKETIRVLQPYLNKVQIVHSDRHPELNIIVDEFSQCAQELSAHMMKEELVLFPYIKAMYESKKKGFVLAKPHFGHVDNPIRMMEHEHVTEGERFQRIAELTDGYTPPKDACQTYRVAFSMLKEFEADLHRHIHLENNVLFTAARQLFLEHFQTN